MLSPERRAALLDWARASGGVVVEDDYDAEFRYDRDPVGALQGLAPDHVVYTGSASKTLAPGLRLGWLVAPAPLADAIVAEGGHGPGIPAMDQLALAELLEHGERRSPPPAHAPDLPAPAGRPARGAGAAPPRARAVRGGRGPARPRLLPADLDEARSRAAAADGIAVSGLTPRRVAPGRARPGVRLWADRGIAIEPGVARLAALIPG